jgi:hypothetical protein
VLDSLSSLPGSTLLVVVPLQTPRQTPCNCSPELTFSPRMLASFSSGSEVGGLTPAICSANDRNSTNAASTLSEYSRTMFFIRAALFNPGWVIF